MFQGTPVYLTLSRFWFVYPDLPLPPPPSHVEFISLSIPQIFLVCLLCVRHWARQSGDDGKTESLSSCPHGANSVVEETEVKQIILQLILFIYFYLSIITFFFF